MAQKKSVLQKKYTFQFSHIALFVSVFALVGIYAVVQSFAAPSKTGGGGGKGGTKSSPNSLSYVVSVDQNGDGLPNYGDTVKFSVSTTVTTEPFVQLVCYQNGTLVYSAQTGLFASYPWPWTQNMLLSSTMWTGGAADCTGSWSYNSNGRTIQMGTLSFKVNA